MATARLPKITWGTSPAFGNTLNVAFFDDAASYPEPGEGSEWIDIPAGVQDAWLTEGDERLAGLIRWIPTADSSDPLATGWDGAAGVRAFLKWAWNGNAFRWFPDRDSGTYVACYLVEPRGGRIPQESDGTRQLPIVIRTADGSAFTGY